MDNKCATTFRRYVTVEPIVFLYSFAALVLWTDIEALTYRKVCMHKYHNSTVCDNLALPEYEVEEDYVQSASSHWFVVFDTVFECLSIFTSLFYGVISDHVSRKASIMCPLIGQLVALTMYVINSHFFDLPVGCIILGIGTSAIFGGWIAITSSTYSYLSDITPKEKRTVKISIVEGSRTIGMTLGLLVSGKLLDATNFTVVLYFSLGIYVIVIVYALVMIKNPEHRSDDAKSKVDKPLFVKMREAMSSKIAKDAITVVVRRRPLNKRKCLILTLSSVFLTMVAITAGRHSLTFLFLKRHPLGWTQTLYGYYRSYMAAISTIGLFVILPILKSKVRLRETTIMMITLVLCGLAEALFGFCTVSWAVFVVGGLSVMSACYMTCIRSVIPSMVAENEIGQVYAVLGSLMSMSGILISLVYNNLYPVTLDYWAGLCFLIGGVVTVFPLTILVYLHIELKKMESYSKLQEEPEIVEKPETDSGTNEHHLDVIT